MLGSLALVFLGLLDPGLSWLQSFPGGLAQVEVPLGSWDGFPEPRARSGVCLASLSSLFVVKSLSESEDCSPLTSLPLGRFSVVRLVLSRDDRVFLDVLGPGEVELSPRLVVRGGVSSTKILGHSVE